MSDLDDWGFDWTDDEATWARVEREERKKVPTVSPQAVGGPLDGISAVRGSSTFRWLDVEGRSHITATPDRHLYSWARDHWLYAGHRFRQCGGCGCFLGGKDEPLPKGACPMCGHDE